MRTMPNPKVFATKRGRRSINMYSPCRTAPESSISAIGSEGRRGDLFLQRRTPPGNHEDRAYGRGLLDLLRTGGVISEVRAERVRIFQNGAADSTPAAPFLILRPNSPTLLRYSLRLGSMQFPALRPALPERLRGWVVLRGRSSHPADSPPIRRDNTTLTRKMRRVLPEAT